MSEPIRREDFTDTAWRARHPLGHEPRFDERSLDFRVYGLTPATTALRSKRWTIGTHLVQQHNDCTSFARAHIRNGNPRPLRPAETAEQAYARYLYVLDHDEYKGNADQGTSVLSTMKIAQEKGDITAYRWAKSTKEFALGVQTLGPGDIGIRWTAGMDEPDGEGFIRPTGGVEGGHSVAVKGVKYVAAAGHRLADGYAGLNLDRSYFIIHNSWGTNWGLDGDCKISFRDMDQFVAWRGEFAIITK